MRLSTAAYGCCVATQPETAGDPLVPFRAHATSASSKVVGWTLSGAFDVRRRPRGLRVATDAGALQIGDLSVRRTSGVSRSQICLRGTLPLRHWCFKNERL